MKHLTALTMIAVLVSSLDPTRSERRCEYTTSKGETIYLEYLQFLGKGEAFVEFDGSDVCLRRASCIKDSILKIEHCDDEKISCDPSPITCNELHFPNCCLKCIRSRGQRGIP